MGVIDNELNWRKAFADSGKDVSGWTLAQRMSLPDWCFGNRRIVSLSSTTTGVGNYTWKISPVVMPANICVWNIAIFMRLLDSTNSWIRGGFRASIPTSEAEMDTAIPVSEQFGNPATTPPRIFLAGTGTDSWQIAIRKGMATGGGKLVIELYCAEVKVSALFAVVYSELPTAVPAFLNPEIP